MMFNKCFKVMFNNISKMMVNNISKMMFNKCSKVMMAAEAMAGADAEEDIHTRFLSCCNYWHHLIMIMNIKQELYHCHTIQSKKFRHQC